MLRECRHAFGNRAMGIILNNRLLFFLWLLGPVGGSGDVTDVATNDTGDIQWES